MEIKPWLKYKQLLSIFRIQFMTRVTFFQGKTMKKMVLKTTNLGRPHLKNDHLTN